VLLAGSLSAGATLVTLARFEIEPFLAAIQEHRVTQTVVVPPVLIALAKHPAVRVVDGELWFLDAIPKSPSGKILRRLLVERERRRAG
jgi:acyl-CoA synthetase (AMP-forming)/AMP-acid ligase II